MNDNHDCRWAGCWICNIPQGRCCEHCAGRVPEVAK